MLTDLLPKSFVPGIGRGMSPEFRTRCGIVSSIAGIACDFLVAVKLTLAVFSGSIAVAADADSGFDTELKLYDFRLKNRETGKDPALNFHLLPPRQYEYTE